MKPLLALGAMALLSIVGSSARVGAQALASPLATLSQRVDSTTISVEYYRPSARGRKLFGDLVPWGAMWTPGANWATTIEVDRDVRIEGQSLPRGKYSVWMIPSVMPKPWTVVLSRAARRFHVVRPEPKDEALRFPAPVHSAPPLDLLTFSFPTVSRYGTMLTFQWGETLLPIRLEIQSSRPPIAAAHAWSSYTGVYELRFAGEATASPIRYEIIERDNALWVRTTSQAVEAGLDPQFDLMAAGGDEFHPRQYSNGTLIGDEVDELIVFTLVAGRATGFEIHGIAEDKILARAVRVRSSQ